MRPVASSDENGTLITKKVKTTYILSRGDFAVVAKIGEDKDKISLQNTQNKSYSFHFSMSDPETVRQMAMLFLDAVALWEESKK